MVMMNIPHLNSEERDAEVFNSTLKDVKKITYPRKCDKCFKICGSKSSFSRHKQMCYNIDKPVYEKMPEIIRIPGNKSLYPRKCEKCSRILKSRQSFSRHKKSCNPVRPIYSRPCEVCKKCFLSPSSFKKHRKGKCKSFNSDESTSFIFNADDCRDDLKALHTCMYCGVSYSSKNFQKHTSSCIGNLPKTYFDCSFSGCGRSFSYLKQLCKHLFAEHGESGVQDLIFESFPLFQQWLKSEGVATFKFKKTTGSKNSNNVIYHYYRCQFYKHQFGKPLGLRKNIKGTIPDNVNCPVSICATEKNGFIKVLYFSQHNHDIKIENCRF